MDGTAFSGLGVFILFFGDRVGDTSLLLQAFTLQSKLLRRSCYEESEQGEDGGLIGRTLRA